MSVNSMLSTFLFLSFCLCSCTCVCLLYFLSLTAQTLSDIRAALHTLCLYSESTDNKTAQTAGRIIRRKAHACLPVVFLLSVSTAPLGAAMFAHLHVRWWKAWWVERRATQDHHRHHQSSSHLCTADTFWLQLQPLLYLFFFQNVVCTSVYMSLLLPTRGDWDPAPIHIYSLHCTMHWSGSQEWLAII